MDGDLAEGAERDCAGPLGAIPASRRIDDPRGFFGSAGPA
jgi:hypothetical protein